MNAPILHLLLLFPFVFSEVGPLGQEETLRIVHEAVGEKGMMGRRVSHMRSTRIGGQAGVLVVTGLISKPVQLGEPMTLSCNSNKALDFCAFKPPGQKAQMFKSSTQLDGGRIKLSERSVRDPRVCELLVDKVEEKDLGKWRCAIRCKCGEYKGNWLTVSETPVKSGYETPVNPGSGTTVYETQVNPGYETTVNPGSGTTVYETPVNPGCIIEQKIDYRGRDIYGKVKKTANQQECADYSASTPGSRFWTWNKTTKKCYPKTSKAGRTKPTEPGIDPISGNNKCGTTEYETTVNPVYGELPSGKLCPHGSAVSSEQECRKAATTIQKQFDHAWIGPNDFPGCFIANDGRDKVFWNLSPSPSKTANKPQFGAICIKNAGCELEPVSATQSSTLWTNQPTPTNPNPNQLLYGAANCIDGVIKPVKRSICHTSNTAKPWIAIDYGTSVTVQRVEIFNRHDCCGSRTQNVDVRISNELPTSGIQMFSGGTLLGHFAGPGTNGQHIIISGHAASGRYVIVQMDNGGDPMNLDEVKAFGRFTPQACKEDGVNHLSRRIDGFPKGYAEGPTDSWQECHCRCEKIKACQGFTWHKPHNTFGSPRNSCSLYSTHVGRKKKDSTVSGRKECFKKH